MAWSGMCAWRACRGAGQGEEWLLAAPLRSDVAAVLQRGPAGAKRRVSESRQSCVRVRKRDRFPAVMK